LTTSKVWSTAVQHDNFQIQQHFFGFEIELEDDFFDPRVVDFMDFRVPQKKETRFVYILPFSKRTALIEFTVFSVHLLPSDEYERELRHYITTQLGLTAYKISRIERGVISMAIDTLPRFSGRWLKSRIQPIGAAAGMVKPSTGYSFSRNQKFLKSGQGIMQRWQWRFYLYDSLILGIIRDEGQRLGHIFSQLFRANPPDQIFQFLDEESRIFDELKIFYSLPWAPFIQRLILKAPFFFGVLLTTLVSPLDHMIAPSIGLFIFGITHGSVDHELSSSPSRFIFFSRYLMGIALYLGLWWLSPASALLLFLILSAQHFGESQFARALKISSSPHLRILAVTWGAFATLAGPLFHWSEALPILRSILRDPAALASIPEPWPWICAVALSGMAMLSAALFDRYELETTNRSRLALPATLLLIGALWVLPLLAGFLCFFAFWHSTDSIEQQRAKLGWSWSQYFRKAWPLTVVSWVALMVLAFFFGSNWGLFFVALAALTFSHARVTNTAPFVC
jgi:Brp/Blh family beta-carotene 15,15'-monooxygenase